MIDILIVCGSYRDREDFCKLIIESKHVKHTFKYTYDTSETTRVYVGVISEQLAGRRFDLIMFDTNCIIGADDITNFKNRMVNTK